MNKGIIMNKLWGKDEENKFFMESRMYATPEQLFYLTEDNKYCEYWPKGYKGLKSTLQSRNTLIGQFTEKWATDLMSEFAQSKGLNAVQGVICEELGLSSQSSADVAICKTKNINQKAEDIFLIFEVKMSIVWNWELKRRFGKEELICLGDYRTHQGNPGLLRSDTMLKATGKSINIRVSSFKSSRIPIIILGNTPISKSYYEKVDYLKVSGIVQGFWSINPMPLDNLATIKSTPKQGFLRIDTYNELLSILNQTFEKKTEFFSSMKSKGELGKIIEIANRESSIEKKAEKFLSLIRE